MLRLVQEATMRATMNRLVLAAAKFVARRLRVGLAGVRLRAAGNLVGAAGDTFFGLVEGGFGGVGSLLEDLLVGWKFARGVMK